MHPLPTRKCFFGRWGNGSCTGKIGDMDVIQSPAPNPAKTKFMWFGTRQQLSKLNLDDLANKLPSYTFSATARDLGVLLDQELTFAPHLHRLSRDCYYQLRQL